MDLYHNDQPAFTNWVIENSHLEAPFVVIDVGVQGGEHARWNLLKEKVCIYGFDAISEAIHRLNEHGIKPNRHYRAMAIGNEDGMREFYVPHNRFSASFYQADALRQTGDYGDGAVGPRMVPISRLDSLFERSEIPPADYIKVDCEGFDPQVLRGAERYIKESNTFCVTVETSFLASAEYQRTPFVEISDILVKYGLFLFDLSYVRQARGEYIAARGQYPWPPVDPRHGMPELDIGQPTTFDVVFCRDFALESRNSDHIRNSPPSVDTIIKCMINFELHGLMDCAVELAVRFRDMLQPRFDVNHAIELLARKPPYARNTADVIACLRMISELRTMVRMREEEIGVRQLKINEITAELTKITAELTKRITELTGRVGELSGELTKKTEQHGVEIAIKDAEITRMKRDATSVRWLAGMLRAQVKKRIRGRMVK
jgi:FkbM family methyltransferase